MTLTAAQNPLQKLITDGVLTHKRGGKVTKDNQKCYLMADQFRIDTAKLGVLTDDKQALATDWVIIHSFSNGWEKYGRSAFSPTLGRLRALSIDEFYLSC